MKEEILAIINRLQAAIDLISKLYDDGFITKNTLNRAVTEMNDEIDFRKDILNSPSIKISRE